MDKVVYDKLKKEQDLFLKREWVCPHCGAIIDRDYNAALNLRDYFYKVINNTVGTTEIKACGETTSTLRETLMQVVSVNQEAPSFRWG